MCFIDRPSLVRLAGLVSADSRAEPRRIARRSNYRFDGAVESQTSRVSLLRFLIGELVVAVGSSARVLGSMNAVHGMATPYRGIAPGAAPLDPKTTARVVRVRRSIAATYATLGLVIPLFVVVRIAVPAWTSARVSDPVSIVVAVVVTLFVALVIGGGLSIGGLLLARPIVNAILKREERRVD
jgi:hypothetical protein